MSRYDFIARFYDSLLRKVEISSILPLRIEYVPKIEGLTLDIAVGTGNNIQFYPKNSKVVLVDKSRKMLEIAREKAKQRKDLDLTFIKSSLESLPFQDNYFDTILSIDVFCSVKDPFKGMKELKRVLKLGGKGIFLEHGKTDKKSTNFSLYLANILTYPTVGSSMTRTPLKYIENTGFKIIETKDLPGTFKYILVKK
jgi:ubiquinone/menaquinone biosynthesis C-methylase UbiE